MKLRYMLRYLGTLLVSFLYLDGIVYAQVDYMRIELSFSYEKHIQTGGGFTHLGYVTLPSLFSNMKSSSAFETGAMFRIGEKTGGGVRFRRIGYDNWDLPDQTWYTYISSEIISLNPFVRFYFGPELGGERLFYAEASVPGMNMLKLQQKEPPDIVLEPADYIDLENQGKTKIFITGFDLAVGVIYSPWRSTGISLAAGCCVFRADSYIFPEKYIPSLTLKLSLRQYLFKSKIYMYNGLES